ncbi:MAG: winged helix-turn-helix domain-containing protein [Hungatella hathewayi]
MQSLHLEYQSDRKERTVQSAGEDISKCTNDTLDCTLEELVLLRLIQQEPTITQKELAVKVGKSERTIKKRTVELQEKGYIRRLNGRRNGRWEILGELPQ